MLVRVAPLDFFVGWLKHDIRRLTCTYVTKIVSFLTRARCYCLELAKIVPSSCQARVVSVSHALVNKLVENVRSVVAVTIHKWRLLNRFVGFCELTVCWVSHSTWNHVRWLDKGLSNSTATTYSSIFGRYLVSALLERPWRCLNTAIVVHVRLESQFWVWEVSVVKYSSRARFKLTLTVVYFWVLVEGLMLVQIARACPVKRLGHYLLSLSPTSCILSETFSSLSMQRGGILVGRDLGKEVWANGWNVCVHLFGALAVKSTCINDPGSISIRISVQNSTWLW
jgi:hypothetical protein